jgi:hypothetical protein
VCIDFEYVITIYSFLFENQSGTNLFVLHIKFEGENRRVCWKSHLTFWFVGVSVSKGILCNRRLFMFHSDKADII